jgi:hypothetical protein
VIETLENRQRKISNNKAFKLTFGNYSVHSLLSMNDSESNSVIINNFLNDFKNNSCGKY